MEDKEMEKSRNDRQAAYAQATEIYSHGSFMEASTGTYDVPKGTSQLQSTNHLLLGNAATMAEPRQDVSNEGDVRYDTVELDSSQNLQGIKNTELPAKTKFTLLNMDKSSNASNSANQAPLDPQFDSPLHITFADSDENTHGNIVPTYQSQIGKQDSQATSSGFMKHDEFSTYRKQSLQDGIHQHGVNPVVTMPTSVYHNLDHYPDVGHACHYSFQGQSELPFRCGACGMAQSTICYLHLHMQGHSAGGLSYHYDHLSRTAFPKFGSICQGTQTRTESETKVNAEMGTIKENERICQGIQTIESDMKISSEIENIRENTLFDMTAKSEKINVMHSCDNKTSKGTNSASSSRGKRCSNTSVIPDLAANDEKKGNSNSNSFTRIKMLEHSFDNKSVSEDGDNSVQAEEMDEDVNDSDDTIFNGEHVNDASDLTAKNNDECMIGQEKEPDIVVSKRKKIIAQCGKSKTKGKQKQKDKLTSNMKNKTKRKTGKVKKKTKRKNDIRSKESQTSVSVSCGVCLKQYSDEESLRKHVQNKHASKTENKILECKWCLKTFETHKIRIDHEKGCEKNDNLKCYICEVVSSCKSELQEHLLVHRNTEDLTCKICSKSMPNEMSMRAHIRRHVQPRTIQCEQCGKAFYYKHLLRKHMVYCNDERPVECPYCDLRFKTKEALKHHSSVHKDDKPFVCHICGYAGKKYMYLKRHIRSHTGERPYPCKVCDMRFSSLNGLNRHNKTHTNTKTCVCSFCGKSFTNNWNLKTHTRQHTGEKPYSCDHCGQAFKQNVLLKLHIKSHHQSCVRETVLV